MAPVQLGALSSPLLGLIVDRIGRKKSAIIYCISEMIMNHLKQYEIIAVFIFSHVVGVITTNQLFTNVLLSTSKREFSEEMLKVVMRDFTITGNMSAFMSGCIAIVLSSAFGAAGPFKAAVT